MRIKGPFRELRGLSFRTTLTLDQILSRSNAEGSRSWGWWSSDALGDYVTSNLDDTVTYEQTGYENRLRFFLDEDRCILARTAPDGGHGDA